MPFLVLPFPTIDPVLVEVGPFAIRWYALAYIVGILLGWWYAKRLVATPALWGPAGSPMKPADIDDFVVYAALGIILGGRVGYVLFYDLPRFAENPAEIVALWHGGMSFHGGFLGTVLAMVLFARARAHPDLVVDRRDRAFGHLRPACSAGSPTSSMASSSAAPPTCPGRWSFRMAGPEPRHPSELYEAGLEGVVLFLVLRILTHRFHKLAQPAFISGAFAAGYGAARTFVEFFREPDIQIGYLAGGLTMGMLLSIPMIAAGIGVMLWASRRTPAAVAAQE